MQTTPATTPGKRRTERLLVTGLALAVIQIFCWEYLLSARPVHLWSDASGFHYPLQRYAFDALKQGRVPLWDSSVYCGMTFAGNVQAALFYPPTWLLYAIEWRQPSLPFKAYEVFIFLHLWLGFVLCYLWLRERCDLLPSILGAGVFALGGYMMWLLLHPGMLGAMTWLPLAFWGVDDAIRRVNWRPLWKVAAASALAFLAGYPAAWLAGCAIVMTYALASDKRWKAAAGAVLALAASALLIAVQLLPGLDARSFMLLVQKYGPGAYSWKTLIEAYLLPNWFNFNPGHATTYEPGALYFYLGIPAIFAIGWAIARHRVRPYLQPLAGIAVALFMANPPHWFIEIVYRTPFLNNTLQPYNFYAGIAPMAALITATSLNDFLKLRGKRSTPWWLAIAASAAAVGWALRNIAIWSDNGHFASHWDSVCQTAIATMLFSLCLWSWRQAGGRARILLAAALLFAVMVDYRVYGSGRWFNAMPGDVDEEYLPYGIAGLDDAGYRAMERNRQFRDVSGQGEGPHFLQYRIYGLATPEGFDPLITVQYRERIRKWTEFTTQRNFNVDLRQEDMLQTLGIRYVTSRNESELDHWLAGNPKFRLIGRMPIFCHVWEYLEAKPPYRFDGAAAPVTWTPERREFQVQSATGGAFRLVEQYFTGWRALVDGQPTPIERWNGAFQSIAVPAGAHRVVFEFRPASVEIGGAVSLLAWIGLLAVWISSRRFVRT